MKRSTSEGHRRINHAAGRPLSVARGAATSRTPHKFTRALLTVLIWLALCAIAIGQTGNATLTGTVQDDSGAVVPGAHVTVTNTATGVNKEAITTGAGLYVLLDLIPGTYTVEATASGLRSKLISDVKLDVDQQASIDFQLAVGSEKQQVTVTGASVPLLQTVDASVGTVVESQQVQDLPLNGRSFTQLLELSPGAVASINSNNFAHPSDPSEAGHQRNGMPAFDINGQSGAATFFRLDGIENNEREFGGANIPISVDAIQEFNLQTSNFSAEYGRSAAQVDVVTKSGTNRFHGSVFEFVRNDVFDAAQWEFSGPHLKNDLKRNQFGGTVGGPIKKDKLFFFASYDGTREVFTEPFLETVPTAAMRTGVFPAGDVIFDPATQQPFPSNTIPQGLWNSISSEVLPYLPAPNSAGTPVTSNDGLPLAPLNDYVYVPQRDQRINQYNGRVDYNLSSKDAFFARYTYGSNLRIGDGPLATNLQGSIIGSEIANLGGQNLAGGWYHTFSPRTISEFHAGFSTDPQDYEKGNTTDYASQFGLSQFLAPNAYKGFPHFVIGSVNLGSGDYRPLKVGEVNYQVNDSLTLIRGAHTLRLGGDLRRTTLLTFNSQLSTGLFYFYGAQTYDRNFPYTGNTYCPGGTDPNGCEAGNGFADFLLGDLAIAERGTPIPPIHKYFSNWAGFVNDTWRVHKAFTISLGLRYEYQTRFHASPPFYTQPIIQNNQFTGMIAVANSSNGDIPPDLLPGALALIPGSVETCRAAGLPDNCLISQKNNWQPRVGFAWQANSKTVLRGGAGIFYGSLAGDSDTESCQSYPLVLTTSTQFFFAPPSGTAPPPLSLSNPFQGGNPAAPTYANCAQQNRKLPSTFQWNLTAERELTPSTTLSVGYVASASEHLDEAQLGTQAQYNIPEPWGVVLAPGQSQQVPDPNFSNIGQFQDVDNASYQSLQVSLRRRLAQGLSLNVAYTYGKSLTTLSWLSDPRNYKLDRGPSADDLSQAVVISPIWQLPFGRGRHWAPGNNVAEKLVGGWEANTIITINSGFPYNPTLSGTNLLLLNGYNSEDRPDRICGGASSHPTAAQWFNPACFVLPIEPTTPGALLREGTAGYDILRGPGTFAEDLGLLKTTQVSERVAVEFRAELFNVFNHPVLGLPNAAINPFAASTTVGEITNPASLPRIIQFALKVHF